MRTVCGTEPSDPGEHVLYRAGRAPYWLASREREFTVKIAFIFTLDITVNFT